MKNRFIVSVLFSVTFVHGIKTYLLFLMFVMKIAIINVYDSKLTFLTTENILRESDEL